MSRSPRPATIIARLRRELAHAAECMRSVSASLDHTNVGRSKYRLIRGADRAARAAGESA